MTATWLFCATCRDLYPADESAPDEHEYHVGMGFMCSENLSEAEIRETFRNWLDSK